jgi:hypothetical protein
MNIGEIAISCAPWAILIWTVASWSEAAADVWGWSLVPLFVTSAISMEFFRWRYIPSLGEDDTNCLLFGCCHPNGKLASLVFRIASLTLIIIQIFIFMNDEEWAPITENLLNNNTNTTLPDDFSKFTNCAKWSSISYSVSGLILLITLCQCGAKLNDTPEDIYKKSEILRWGLHDLILGLIWTALAFQFHDVVDDYDDSHWRHLFSSMIVFHVIILLIDIMSNPKYQIDWERGDLALWSEATKPAIKMMIRFVFYAIIYYCILNRLHDSDDLLINMGLDDISTLAVYISTSGLILVNITELNDGPVVLPKEKVEEEKQQQPMELPLRKGRRSLNF